MVRGSTALALAVVVTGALSTSRALADAADAADAAEPAAPHHFVFGQALSVLIRRIGVGYELLPVRHHSIGLNIHGQWPGTKYLSPAAGEVAGFGSELGYRYYTGRHGPNGPFFGASFLLGYYYSRTSFLEHDPTALWYAQYGWAIDMGWATYFDKDIVFALTIGVQRTWVGVDRARITDQAHLINGEGVRPRAQILIGRAF